MAHLPMLVHKIVRRKFCTARLAWKVLYVQVFQVDSIRVDRPLPLDSHRVDVPSLVLLVAVVALERVLAVQALVSLAHAAVSSDWLGDKVGWVVLERLGVLVVVWEVVLVERRLVDCYAVVFVEDPLESHWPVAAAAFDLFLGRGSLWRLRILGVILDLRIKNIFLLTQKDPSNNLTIWILQARSKTNKNKSKEKWILQIRGILKLESCFKQNVRHQTNLKKDLYIVKEI